MDADFPESEAIGMRSQMRRASVSICCNIAVGCGRRGDREFRRFLDIAMGSACELECGTILSFDLVLITEGVQERVLAILIEIKRMLGGLISRLACPTRRRRDNGQTARRARVSPDEPGSLAES